MLETARPARLVIISTALLAHAASAQGKPYTLDNITDLLRGGVSSEHVLALATQSCIAFKITPDTESRLRAARADVILIAALRSACYRDPSTRIDITRKPTPSVVPNKVVKPVVIAPAPDTRPASGTKYYRYLLSTKRGDMMPAGELKSAPQGPATYYKVESDTLGRIVRILYFGAAGEVGKPYLDVRRYYSSGSRFPDSTASIQDDQPVAASRLERDESGNQVKETSYYQGKPSYVYRRVVFNDSVVQETESVPNNGKTTKSVLFYSPAGILTSQYYEISGDRYETRYSQTTENAEVQIHTWPNGEKHERRYVYDVDGFPKSVQLFVNGTFICTFTYEWISPGEARKTIVKGPDGKLMAEYPNSWVTDVNSDGFPDARHQGTLYKPAPWW